MHEQPHTAERQSSRPIILLIVINAAVGLVSFMKDVVMGAYLGTTTWADAWSVAFFVPDTVGNNLIGSALNSVSVPIFTKLLGSHGWRTFVRAVLRAVWTTVLLGILIIIFLYLFEHPLVSKSVGQTSDLFRKTVAILSTLVPVTGIFILAALGYSVLQSLKKFVVPALGPLAFNVVWLVVIAVVMVNRFDFRRGVFAVSFGVVFAGAVVAIFVWLAIVRSIRSHARRVESPGSSVPAVTTTGNANVFMVSKQVAPYLALLATSQVTYFVERVIASRMETGTVAGLNYAFRLAQFPNWIFVAALTSVILPNLAEMLLRKQRELIRKTMALALRFALAMTLPIAILLYLFRTEIVSVLFRHGAFTEESVSITAAILAWYALSIVGQAVTLVALRFFVAEGELIVPMVISMVAMGVNISLDFPLTKSFGPLGLGLGAFAGTLVSSVLLVLVLQNRLQLLKDFAVDLFKIILANCIPVCFIVLLHRFVQFNALHLLSTFLLLLGACTLYLVTYVATLWKFRLLPNKGVHAQ